MFDCVIFICIRIWSPHTGWKSHNQTFGGLTPSCELSLFNDLQTVHKVHLDDWWVIPQPHYFRSQSYHKSMRELGSHHQQDGNILNRVLV